MGARSETVFSRLSSFTEVVDGFDKSVKNAITAHIIHFEIAWCASKHDGELPSGYHAEQDKEVVGPYQLYQIRVGPGRTRGYRAWVMFLDGSPDAYWVYAFKKGKGRQPEDMERARVLAQRHWEKIRRRSNASR
jgi:hypothetical protein